jgi:hypothetical protein
VVFRHERAFGVDGCTKLIHAVAAATMAPCRGPRDTAQSLAWQRDPRAGRSGIHAARGRRPGSMPGRRPRISSIAATASGMVNESEQAKNRTKSKVWVRVVIAASKRTPIAYALANLCICCAGKRPSVCLDLASKLVETRTTPETHSYPAAG